MNLRYCTSRNEIFNIVVLSYSIIKFYLSAVGCDEQQLPAGVRVRTVGDITTLTCNYTGIMWRGECHNGQWRASQQDSNVIRCEPPSTDHVRALTSVGVDQQMSLTYG